MADNESVGTGAGGVLAAGNTLSKIGIGVPMMVQWKRIRLGTMRFRVPSLTLLNGLKIWRCPELWCRLQMRLGSGVAMAVV